jgi:hypothetical protein
VVSALASRYCRKTANIAKSFGWHSWQLGSYRPRSSDYVHVSPLRDLNLAIKAAIKAAKTAKRVWRAALEAAFPFFD